MRTDVDVDSSGGGGGAAAAATGNMTLANGRVDGWMNGWMIDRLSGTSKPFSTYFSPQPYLLFPFLFQAMIRSSA